MNSEFGQLKQAEQPPDINEDNPIEEFKVASNQSSLAQKVVHVAKFNGKEDLTDSDMCGTVSPMITEELLINEKIELLSSDNLSVSENFSLTYTKTLGSEASSSFGGMRVSNVFVNSSPESHNQSFLNMNKNSSLGEVRLIRSQTDDMIEYLKIPNLTLQSLRDEKVKILIEENLRHKTCEDVDYQKSEGFYMDAEDAFPEQSGKKSEDNNVDELMTAGRAFDIKAERPSGMCNCHWCITF